MEEKNEIILYVQNISLFFLGILFLAFPVIFTTITTNPFILPKQTLLGIVVAILLVLQIVKMFIQKSVKYRRTSFDIPVFLLGLAAFLSAMLAINKADALTAFIPYFFAILGFYLIINIVKDKNSLLFLMPAHSFSIQEIIFTALIGEANPERMARQLPSKSNRSLLWILYDQKAK